MNESPTLGALAAALAKAQGQMENAIKDKSNPFFKSSYADLASVWEACRMPLTSNGLSITQALGIKEGGGAVLITKLLHTSGEWISSTCPINPVKNDPQSMGSAITYMRRFSLSALVGIAAVDDDGNAASHRPEREDHQDHLDKEELTYREIFSNIKVAREALGMPKEQLEVMAKSMFGNIPIPELDYKQLNALLAAIKMKK